MDKRLVVIALILGALTLGAGGVAVYMQTRGLRNNNPGNIRKSSTVWQGQAAPENQTDSSFVKFTEPFWGIRAMARTLKTYREKYGADTIRRIITRWAPPNENPTGEYVAAVAKRLGVRSDDVLPLEKYPELVAAIIHQENGIQPYGFPLIEKATKAGLA